MAPGSDGWRHPSVRPGHGPADGDLADRSGELAGQTRWAPGDHLRAGSGHVCPLDDAAEPFVVGVVFAPDDVPADHVGLFLVPAVVGAVEGKVPQGGELDLDAV